MIGVEHHAVFALQIFKAGVEGVTILHQEFAAAHYAKARADLVAELGLNLIQMQRELSVALDFLADEIGDHFFMGRPNDEITLVTIFEAQ